MQWPASDVQPLRAADVPCDAVTVTQEEAKALKAVDVLGLRWPVYARAITSYFGIRQDPIVAKSVRFHKGLDVSAANGSLVYSAAPGIVLNEGWAGGHGYQVVIDHGGGLKTAYSHLHLPLVSRGQQLGEGVPIGVVGDTGRSTGPHLHFEVSLDNQPVDPYPLLGGRLPTPDELGDSAPPRFIYANR